MSSPAKAVKSGAAVKEKDREHNSAHNPRFRPNQPQPPAVKPCASAKKNTQNSKGADETIVVFTGQKKGQLVPYEAPQSETVTKLLATFRLYPTKTAADACTNAVVASKEQLPEQVLQRLLIPGTQHHMAFGTQIVCVAHEAKRESDAGGVTAMQGLDAAYLTSLLCKPLQSPFVPLQLREAESLIDFLRKYLNVGSVQELHIIRVTEGAAAGKGDGVVYERTATSRETLFDNASHLAWRFRNTHKTCPGVVFVPHASPQNAKENYVLFRCRGTMPSRQMSCTKNMQLVKSDGTWRVEMPAEMAVKSVVCYEVRYVIAVKGSEANIVVRRLETRSGLEKIPRPVEDVTIEIEEQMLPIPFAQRLKQWTAFLQLSDELCRRLAQLVTSRAQLALARPKTAPCKKQGAADVPVQVKLTGGKAVDDADAGGEPVDDIADVPQFYCASESAAAPCNKPRCELWHRYTMCLEDGAGGCVDDECRFWHAFSQARRTLAGNDLGLELVESELDTSVSELCSFARLRAALSTQLLRIHEVLSSQLFGIDAGRKLSARNEAAKLHLVELVKQYNAAVHSLRKVRRDDVAIFLRCCRRLECPLPLLAAQDEVRDACFKGAKYLLVDSATGSGKSTQLPQYLAECATEQQRLNAAREPAVGRRKLVICVEPRALAAVSLADYVAAEYDGPDLKGERRVQSLTSGHDDLRPGSHIVYTTDHFLLALMRSGEINFATDVYAVILDEAHERSIAVDMLLGILKAEVQRTNSAFKLVVCSATMQIAAFQAFLPHACHICVGGRPHNIEVVYASRLDRIQPEANYVQETVDAVIRVLNDPPSIPHTDHLNSASQKHILAFLPAAADVLRAQTLLENYVTKRVASSSAHRGAENEEERLLRAVRVCTISGRQNVKEQRSAFSPSVENEQKVIFATPVAESSVTIDGVGYVVDCGLTRVPRYDSVRHLTELVVCPITQGSAVQRAGRAGRTGPGVCIRLYTQTCFNLFEKDKSPAIKTAPLHMVTLQLAQLGHSTLTFDWIDKPDGAMVEATLSELALHEALKRLPIGAPPALTPFGEFLLGLDDVSVALGRLLYDAKKSGNDDLLALAAMTAATIQLYPALFSYPDGEEHKFFTFLHEFGRRYAASSYGDVLCAVRLVVAARQVPKPSNEKIPLPTSFSAENFLGRCAVKNIVHSQRRLYCSAVTLRSRGVVAAEKPHSPVVTLAVIEAHADELRKLLARCFCTQVAVRRAGREVVYKTVGAAAQVCLLERTSFMKQQHLLPTPTDKSSLDGKTPQHFDCSAFPDLCVFSSLSFDLPKKIGVLSLCTPVNIEWLPDSVQAMVRRAQEDKPVTMSTTLPSAILNEWQPQEVSNWLSRKLNGVACTVTMDGITNKLSVACEQQKIDVALSTLSKVDDHARARHRQTCYEVALNGFCRVTWKAGCEAGEVLRDKNEYVTLQFSGACDPAITCLDLDLSEMVEAWSWRWFGRRMLVTVRSGSGGASPASGQWTALVTFVNSREARDFYARHETAVEADCRKVLVEPYCEQEPLAPSVDATVPLCRIGLRLYTNHFDPESDNTNVRKSYAFPIELVKEFQRLVCAALPDGVVAESRQMDQSQGLLYMVFVAANAKVADEALVVLHSVRGPFIHYRALFFDVAYSVEFPLPSLVNKTLQGLLQSRVSQAGKGVGGAVVDGVRCSTFNTQGRRSLLLRGTDAAQLHRAQALLRDAVTISELQFPGKTKTKQTNQARAVAAQCRYVVSSFNQAHKMAKDHIFECQLQFRAADGRLCFIGTATSYEKIQQFLTANARLCSAGCTTLTLPLQMDAAARCNRWVLTLAARCRANRQFTHVSRDGDAVVFIAPTEVLKQAGQDPQVAQLWRAIDGEANEGFDLFPGQPQRRDAGAAIVTSERCALCFDDLQPDNIQLLCGHRFCAECLAGAFSAEGGAAPEPPIGCACCRALIAADEISLFAPVIGLKRLSELTRTRLVAEAAAKHVEAKACPNNICLGVPKVVTYANRKCSGCDLAYCEVCIGNGAVRPWHEGSHYSPAEILADSLVEQLPLLPKCPQCSQLFYNFDGCFAISCSKGHSFCGFCMKGCGTDAHAHVLRCPRNPCKDSYFAGQKVFYKCRSEDLAQQMKDVVLHHPAASLQLARAVCSKVKERMSDDWPRAPIDAAEKTLEAHKWGPNAALIARPLQPVEAESSRAGANHLANSLRISAADAAGQVLLQITSAFASPSPLSAAESRSEEELRASVAMLRDMCIVDLCDFVGDALQNSRTPEEAAVLLYAVYDVNARVETALRSLGMECHTFPGLTSFIGFVLRGLRLCQEETQATLKRNTLMTASQIAQYHVGETVVWDAPTICKEANPQSQKAVLAGNETLFIVHSTTFARVALPLGASATKYVLSGGARLRVTKVAQRIVYLQQESDLTVSAPM